MEDPFVFGRGFYIRLQTDGRTLLCLRTRGAHVCKDPLDILYSTHPNKWESEILVMIARKKVNLSLQADKWMRRIAKNPNPNVFIWRTIATSNRHIWLWSLWPMHRGSVGNTKQQHGRQRICHMQSTEKHLRYPDRRMLIVQHRRHHRSGSCS